MVQIVFKGAYFSITKIISANDIKAEHTKLLSNGINVVIESITKLN